MCSPKPVLIHGTAVRIATEINLHRCISKMPHVKRDCYIRTRLYFLVYVCDHHFSVAYGRPPMTRDFEAASTPMQFLESEYATEDDARLISQIEIWAISSRIFETFGVDTEMPVPERLLPQLRRLNIALDTWRADWNDRFAPNEHVGNYPRKGVGLHYHFAKLYLCSHAFRGLSRANRIIPELSAELGEHANAAIASATSILRVVGNDNEVQSYLDGLPSYFNTMIAFAMVFLLRIATKYADIVQIDKNELFRLVGRLVSVLKDITSRMDQRHVLFSIAQSVEKLLDKCRQNASSESASQTRTDLHQGSAALEIHQDFTHQDWMVDPSDPLYLGNFDLLGPQDGMDGLDFNLDNFYTMP